MSATIRLGFDGGLVLRDGKNGKVWFVEGEAAQACLPLSDVDILSLLSEVVDDAAPCTLGRGAAWSAPEAAPALDLLLTAESGLVRVRVWDAWLAGVLAEMLSPAQAAAGGTSVSTLDLFTRAGRSTVAVDGHIVQDAIGHRWWVLVREVARSLHPGRDWLGVIHAATIAEDGRAVAISGASGAGKTTLAGGLLAAGAALVSDDATPIEAGTRLAWRCPLAMGVKEGAWPIFAAMFEGFGGETVVRDGRRRIRYFAPPQVAPDVGYPLAAIVFPIWQDGAMLQAEVLRPAETLSLLSRNGMAAPETESQLVDLLDWLAELPAWRLIYSELDQAVAFTRDLLVPRDA